MVRSYGKDERWLPGLMFLACFWCGFKLEVLRSEKNCSIDDHKDGILDCITSIWICTNSYYIIVSP